MKQEGSLEHVSSDSPIQSKSQDILGRQPFAERLAKALLNLKSSDSIVLSLEGSWGSGKTSIFYLMKEYIEALPQNQQNPILIPFNPWWFSSKDDLAFRFFEELSANLPSNEGKAFQNVFKGLKMMGKVLKHIPSMETLGKITEEAANNLINTPSLPKLKEQLSTTLIENKISLWVFVDDIDRLFPEEVLQMLSLIRGVGDISNIKYILAYDRVELEKRIGKALQENDPKKNSNYLDKIVQVTFPIPDTANWHIRKLLGDGFTKVLGEDKITEELVTEFRQLWELIELLLKTPRDIKRLINSFNLIFSSAEESLHPIDFLGLEILRMFFPELHSELPHNKHLLLGNQGNRYYKPEDRTHDANRLIGAVKDEKSRETAQDLLEWLFPELKNLHSGQHLFPKNSEKWNEQKRICSSNYFEAYFQLTIPPSTLNESEVSQLLDYLGDANKLSNLLLTKNDEIVETVGTTRALLLIDGLKKHIEAFRDPNILKTTLEGLLNAGDAIAKTNAQLVKNYFSLDFTILLTQLIVKIVKELGNNNVSNVLTGLFASSHSLHSVMAIFNLAMSRSQPKDGEKSDPLFTKEQVELFHKILSERVNRINDIKEIETDHPLFITTLYRLQLVTGSFDKSKALVAQLISSHDGILIFMRAATSVTYGSRMNERGSVNYLETRANKKIIEQFTNFDEFTKKLPKLSEASSDGQKKEILEYLDSLKKDDFDG